MEKLKVRYYAMYKALATLDEGIKEFAIPLPERPKAYKLMRDGVTQRFEYCIDTFWKLLKIHLELIIVIDIELPSPTNILRLASKSNVMTDDELKILLDCLTDRNLTSHTYDEKIAEKIYQHIPLYYQTMKNVVDRLKLEKLN